MNAMCRSCLCVVVLIGCMSAWAEEKPNPKQSEYGEWIKPYTAKFSMEGQPLKLLITAVYGGEDPSNNWPRFINATYVSVDWRVRNECVSSRGVMGCGGSILKEDQTRLDQWLSKLPDDGSAPPASSLIEGLIAG